MNIILNITDHCFGFGCGLMFATGRGSVYRLDQFGRRGEGVLVPDFCCLEEPESSSCIHFGTEAWKTAFFLEQGSFRNWKH